MFWRIIIGIALNLLAAVFLKPKPPRPGTIDDFSIPRADEGAKVFDFAGTAWRKDPIVAWFGNFASNSRGNGLYHYFLGFHLVLCRQIDALLAINLSEKKAWRGRLLGGQRGKINKDKLFGGTFKEGGFIGEFDLLNGNPSQPVNDYLQSQLGEITSAFRGVASLVFRKPYVAANTARLPSMKFKILNVDGISRGWQPEKAIIGLAMEGGGASIYIAMDTSPSMATGSRFDTQKAALAGFVRSLIGTSSISVRVVAFSATVTGAIERFDCTDADFEEVATWIEDFTGLTSGTDYGAAVASSPAFFALDAFLPRDLSVGSLLAGITGSEERRRKIIIFVTDGGPAPTSSAADAVATRNSISDVELFAFNIDLTDTTYTAMLDNTPGDGVPVVTGANPTALTAALSGAFVSWADVNPAHIIRCLWTDPMRGGVAQDIEIGDSFEVAADQLLAEGFGLSVPFRGADLVESDRLEVERHVDAVSYRSRRTGKIELKLIRNDYVIGDLPVLDSSVVMEWSGLERSSRGETANQLTVIYTKRENGETASVTRTNVAGVRRAGRVIPGDPVEYPFITTARLGTRACLRDLSVQDKPLLAGTLRLAYLPPELEIGEPFILNEPLLGINNVVVRVMESQEGNGRDNSVTVQVSEDRYILPAEDVVGDDVDLPIPTPDRAEPSPVRVVQEAPYYLLLQASTQTEVNTKIAAAPTSGAILATGTKPAPAHDNITVAVDSGAGYLDAGTVEFTASAITLSALTSRADDDVVTIPNNDDLDTITASSLALIGTELVRIDSFATNVNFYGFEMFGGLMYPVADKIDVTLARGCLDTVPLAHTSGSRVFFLQGVTPREIAFIADTAANVKLLTNLPSDTLSLAAAPVDSLTFAARAIRPYPPGNFRVNGVLPGDAPVLPGAAMVLTWAHRNRLQQTVDPQAGHLVGNIGPEAGTFYRVRRSLNGAVLSETDTTDTTITLDAVNILGFYESPMFGGKMYPTIEFYGDLMFGGEMYPDVDFYGRSMFSGDMYPVTPLPLKVEVFSVRDGFLSWTAPHVIFGEMLPPQDLTAIVL